MRSSGSPRHSPWTLSSPRLPCLGRIRFVSIRICAGNCSIVALLLPSHLQWRLYPREINSAPAVDQTMTQRFFLKSGLFLNSGLLRIPAAFAFSTVLLAASTLAQTKPAVSQSPYGGVTVEDIVAHVNDQVITQSDYDRAMKEIDDEAKQHGATMQQISEQHKDLLRSLIDQQLWLSKAKELNITGETELIKRLDEIRKQYNLETLEDLAKAAKEQGYSYEDFKANIRNQIITQEVMREEVGRRVQITPGEVQRYFD